MYLIYLILGEKELTDHNKAFMLKKKIQTKNIALFTYAPFKVEWIFESKETFCIHWFQAFLFSFFIFYFFKFGVG